MVALTVAFTGCGSNAPSAQQQIRNAVSQFTVDIGQHGWKQACPLTWGTFRATCAEMASSGSGTQGICSPGQVSPSSVIGQSCARLQRANTGLSSFTRLTISKIVVTGSAATVAFNGSSEVINLFRNGGHWLISNG